MKFYLASSFDYKDHVKELASWLEERGHTITCRWWLIDYKEALGEIPDAEWYGRPIVRTIYQRSFKAIEDADALILVAPRPKSFNGANIEVGIALGLRKHTICFGESERSGMYEPLIRCKDYGELEAVMVEFEEH